MPFNFCLKLGNNYCLLRESQWNIRYYQLLIINVILLVLIIIVNMHASELSPQPILIYN